MERRQGRIYRKNGCLEAKNNLIVLEFSNLAKIFIFTGMFLLLLGVVMSVVGKIPFVGRLPGDILLERQNFRLYFPLATCVLLSVLFSFLFWVLGGFFRK